MNEQEYILGVNETELERLRFQHKVWGRVTNAFFDRLGVAKGWKCMDAGAGPGFVAFDLLERIGETGEITLLDQSAEYLAWFSQEAKRKDVKNFSVIHGSVETAALPKNAYDFIFSRWVIDFVPDPELFLARLIGALKPGGVIALEDYYHEAQTLIPRGGAFERMSDAVRAYYRFGGGDAYAMGSVPAWFRKNGVTLIDYFPNCIAGDCASDIIEWSHRFFVQHVPLMAEKGIISQAEADELLADWHAHRNSAETIYFSPLVVDAAGRFPLKS